MIEYEYPECTTSVITSLAIFRNHYPNYRAEDIEYVIHTHYQICRFNRAHFINRKTIRRSITFLYTAQQPEGGWVGSWGICFTYATMFALESLSLVGETYGTSESARRACDFLVSKQKADGGWGESYKVCHIPPSSL
jgi:lanosterol synthase